MDRLCIAIAVRFFWHGNKGTNGMIRILIVLSVLPAPAFAHFGHVADVAGHDHWVIGAALGAAIAAGILGALKGKDDPVEDFEEQEA